MEWYQRQSDIWHPFGPLKGGFPVLPLLAAQGSYLITTEGRKIIDGISSWWVNIHGHAHPELAKVLFDQYQTLDQVIFAGFTHEPAETLASHLLVHFQRQFQKVFFSDDGSTAVEVALKLAIQYWELQHEHKPIILALEGAYHGDTFGAMALGDRGLFTKPFHNRLF